MPTEPNPISQVAGLSPESRHWVDASATKRPLFNWRELVIRGLHFSGALGISRRISKSYELRPDSSLKFPKFRRIQNPKLVILCYHGIGESGNPLVAAPSVETFEAQMRFLRENYRIVSLDEAFRELSISGGREPAVAITFDDGYRNAYTLGFPILQKYKVPATIYLTVESVETGQVAWYDRVFLAMAVAPSGELHLDLGGPWRFQLNSPADRLRAALEVVALLRTLPNCRRRDYCALLEKKIGLPPYGLCSRMLTWEQVLTMRRTGIFFGSHTLSHPVVSQLSPGELESELGDSKKILEDRLGEPVLDFAFPFGKASDFNNNAIQELSRCGYRSAVTTAPGVNVPGSNLYELRRLQVGCNESLGRFAFNLNQTMLRTESAPLLHPSSGRPSPSECEVEHKSSLVTLGEHDA